MKVIGASAFSGNPWLVRVYFEEGIEEIRFNALIYCSKLESISLPSSLKTLYGGFEGVSNVTSLILPEGLKTIANGFLYGLRIQGTVTIPASLDTIIAGGNGVSATGFEGYVVQPGNQHFKSDNGVLLSKDGSVLYGVPTSASWATEYTTPSTVKDVFPGCFYWVPYLTTLTFTEGVIDAANAINTCSNLTTLNLPSTLQTTPFSSYAAAYKLLTINVTEGSQYLSSKDGILYNADKTEVLFVPAGRHYDTLEFPSTVTTVGNCAMIAINVNRFTFGPNVRLLRSRSIVNCGRYNTALTDAGKTCIIPASLTTVDSNGILLECWFDEYLVEEGNPSFIVQNNMLLSKDGSRLYAILLKRGAIVDTLVVPSTVTSCNSRVSPGNQQFVRVLDYSQTKITTFSSYAVGGVLDGFQVKLPNTLEVITGGVTIFSATMKSLEIPASVTSIAPASLYLHNLEELTFWNPNKFTSNSIFGVISPRCVIRGYKGSSAEDVARQYTLRFEPLD